MMKKIDNLSQPFFEHFLQSFELSPPITIIINVATIILSLINPSQLLPVSQFQYLPTESITFFARSLKPRQNNSKL